MGPAVSRSEAGAPAGAGRDDLGADRDRGLLRRAGADVEPDRRHDPRDVGVGEARLPQPHDATFVGAARAHRADVPDLGLHRGDDRGHVELVVVRQHAHDVALR